MSTAYIGLSGQFLVLLYIDWMLLTNYIFDNKACIKMTINNPDS